MSDCTTRHRTATGRNGSLLVLVVLTGAALTAAGPEPKYKAPRTEYGQPDFRGVWNFSSDVPLERPRAFADKAYLTREEREKRIAAREAMLDGLAKLAPVDDKVYLDYSPRIENLRTSLITYPENGRMPNLVEGVQRLDPFAAVLSGVDSPGSRPVRFTLGGIGKDGPEDRGLSERCVGGPNPPFMPDFNNNYMQLFQTRDYVVFLRDGSNDARIVPLDGRLHLGEKLRSWSGDSRGRWEGETLVVETRNFNGLKQSFDGTGTSYGKVVTERFTRVARNVLEYEATIVDPKTFQDKIVLSFPMAEVESRIYETACHEGNYSMPMTLAGARKEEQEATKTRQ
jgi:hypothetical protein